MISQLPSTSLTPHPMKPSDEIELHRLSDMLQAIDRNLERTSPLREGLQKAGLATHSKMARLQGGGFGDQRQTVQDRPVVPCAVTQLCHI
jgi:hypothetical protein